MSKVADHLMDLQYRLYEQMEVLDGIQEALCKNQEKASETMTEILPFIPGIYKKGDRIRQPLRGKGADYIVEKVLAYVDWRMKWVTIPGEEHQKRVRDCLEIKVSYTGRQILKGGKPSGLIVKLHSYWKYEPPMVNYIKLDGGPYEGSD